MITLPHGFGRPVVLGGGAFGVVVRARQNALDRQVAIKMVACRNRHERDRILQEGRTLATLRISCVPQVFDAFVWHAHVCIVMEWVKGVDLTTILRQPLTLQQRMALATGLVRAVATLHRTGFAHRDIKPGNILVSPVDGIHLVDLGFGKNIMDMQRSLKGTVRGTPAYMAPELWRTDGDADLKSADVFSAGKVLEEISPGTCCAGLIQECLDNRPQARPATGEELLERWLELPDAGAESADWCAIAGAATMRHLAASLLSSAGSLYAAKRLDEAYWLAVECLELEPDNADALDLMESFAHRHRGPGKVAAVLGVGAVLVSALLLGVWFSLRRPMIRATVTDYREEPSADDRLRTNPEHAGVRHAAYRQLKQFDERQRHLDGLVEIVNVPAGGTLWVDGVSQVPDAHARVVVALPGGTHLCAWHDATGVVGWHEEVRVLPFQIRRVNVWMSPSWKTATRQEEGL